MIEAKIQQNKVCRVFNENIKLLNNVLNSNPLNPILL